MPRPHAAAGTQDVARTRGGIPDRDGQAPDRGRILALLAAAPSPTISGLPWNGVTCAVALARSLGILGFIGNNQRQIVLLDRDKLAGLDLQYRRAGRGADQGVGQRSHDDSNV
jgi:hypothetical protein